MSKTVNKKQSASVMVGAHVSSAGGAHKAMERAHAIGARAVQLFGASPVQWKAPLPTEKDSVAFKKARKQYGIDVVVLHAPYLINVASEKAQVAAMSRTLLKNHLAINNALGADGVIFHIGTRGSATKAEAEKKVVTALKTILHQEKEGRLLIENSAGAGNLVGATLEEIGSIIEAVDDKRLGFCYDTAHGFEAGVLTDMTDEGVNKFVKNINKTIGLDRLWVIHANDSKTPANSNKDRHENIGDGYIGSEGFRALTKNNKLRSVPFILEVPGVDGDGPDEENIKRLLALSVI